MQCSKVDCTKEKYSGELCRTHYTKKFRDKLVGDSGFKQCSQSDCKKNSYAKGMCFNHYSTTRNSNEVCDEMNWNKCSINDCKKSVYGHGMCGMHLRRQKLNGDPEKTKYRKIGTGTINNCGYKQIWKPGHPCADKRGLAMEHRIIMSEIIGRPLKKNEQVHHKNGIKTDNTPENLELWCRSQPSGQRISDILQKAGKILCDYRSSFSEDVIEESYEIKFVKHIHEEPELITITYNFSKPGKINKAGYKMIHNKSGSNSTGYIMEHRHIMQLILGRVLLKNENVHHIDGNKLNNKPENLELWCRNQPSGQRVIDMVNWAKSIVKFYKNESLRDTWGSGGSYPG